MADRESGRTFRQIVRILAGRFVGMVLILAIVLAAVGAVTYFLPRTYRSEVGILAKPSRQTNPLETPGADLQERVSLFVTTQHEIILSDYVVASALLAVEGRRIPPYDPEDQATLDRWDEAVRTYISGEPDKNKPGHRDYLAKVKRRLEVVTPGGLDGTFSQTFTIRVDWPEEADHEPREFLVTPSKASRRRAAKRAYDFAQYMVQAYLARYARLESEQTRKASALLTEKALASAKADLDKAVGELTKFTEAVKGDLLAVINLTSRYTAGAETGVSSLRTRFQGEIDTVQDQLAETEARLAVVQAELAKADDETLVVPDALTAENPSLTTLQGKIVALKLALTNLLARYTEEYQEVKNTREELAATQKELRGEMQRQQTRLQQRQSVLQARLAKLGEIVSQHKTRADELAVQTATYERLRNAVAAAQQIYDEEKKRVVSAATAESLAANPILVQVLDQPSYPDPDEPYRPIVWVNLLVAGLAGLVLALVYAFLADHLDHSIKSIDDAEEHLQTPVLASVPKLGRGIIRCRRRPAADDDARSPRAWVKASAEEIFAGLWASLFHSGRNTGKSALICSADRQEGATTIAVGLGLAGSSSVATGSVALVDLNLRDPAVHDVLGLRIGAGVAEIVLEGLASESAAQPVNLGLDVFTVGAVEGRALEVLRSSNLPAFLEGLEQRYEHVLVDAAPANRFSDAQVLAKIVRDVLLVARTERTPREALALAKRRIEASGGRLVGTVLNLRTYPIPKFLYRRV